MVRPSSGYPLAHHLTTRRLFQTLKEDFEDLLKAVTQQPDFFD